MKILAKKYNESEESLSLHLLKNKWAAEVLLSHEKTNKRLTEVFGKVETDSIKEGIILATLFHDFGKANRSFQAKLITPKKNNELLTHDAISFLFVIWLYEQYEKKHDFLLYCAYASLKHHNRSIIIDKVPESQNKMQSTLDEALSDIEKYTEIKNEKINIDDSQWIRRSHVNGMGEVVRINIIKEVVDVYHNSALIKDLPFLEKIKNDNKINEFINLINSMNKKETIAFFIDSLRFLTRTARESDHDHDEFYSKLLITKNLFKICDEFASRDDVSSNSESYKKHFQETLESLFFFDDNSVSPLAQKILDGEIKPNLVQEELIKNDNLSNCILLSSNTGGGKTVSAELIKYKKNLNFISYHTPTRFLALEQASRIFNDMNELLVAKKIRYMNNMSMYHHTIDQIYLALVGYKREYFLLKLFFNGIVVFDEVDIFQDKSHFFNIAFMLRILSSLKIPVVITTATATPTLKDIIEKNYKNAKFEEYPKNPLKNTAIRAKSHVFENKVGNGYVDSIIKDLIAPNYQSGKKIGLFFNNVSSCVKMAVELEKFDIPYILYHSRLCTEVKEENKKVLLNTFGKEGSINPLYPIAIMSPLAEVGVDISFEVMISDSAPIRNIEQRMGRLNRWRNFNDCLLYILTDYICGFGSFKNKHKPKFYNGQEVISFDPYFADELTSLNQHNDVFIKRLDGIDLGYEENFISDTDPNLESDMKKYKELWFEGVLNDVKRYIQMPRIQKIVPFIKIDYQKEYNYSLSMLPYFFIRSLNPKNINPCFREVNAVEYIVDDKTKKREYSSIPEYFLENNSLKKDFIEKEKYGIVKKWIF